MIMKANYIDPYKVLNITRRLSETMSENEFDNKILRMKNNLIEMCQKSIESDNNIENQSRMIEKINEINYAYTLIKDAEARQREEEKQLMQQEKISKLLEAKSLKANIENNLIKTKENGTKAIEETVYMGKDIFLEDYKGRNLMIKEIGQINYSNSLGLRSTMYEYMVQRRINGIVKKNKIFTDIDLHELSVKPNREPINRKYYDKVANELLSEVNLFISRINYNYVGVVEKSNRGYYVISTEDKTLEGNLRSVDCERITVAHNIMNERNKECKTLKNIVIKDNRSNENEK